MIHNKMSNIRNTVQTSRNSQMDDNIYLYGAGGHARVIAGILASTKRNVIGILDDDKRKKGAKINDYEVLCYEDYREKDEIENSSIIIAIGDNKKRKNVVNILARGNNIKYATAIHSSALVNERVIIEGGTVVMAGVVINCDVKIGQHVIVNTSSSIDHDCEIGDYVHISPGVHIGGDVKVGEESWIGLGSAIINNCKIGRNVIVGAGSVVIKDIPDSWVVVGNPARFLRMNKK